MSKSRNIKRAKLLRQRKKERQQPLPYTTQLEEDRKLLMNRTAIDETKLLDRTQLGRKEKISTLLLEMIITVLRTAKDEEDARGIVNMGIVARNCGVIKQIMGEEHLKEVMKNFESNKFPEERRLLDEYIQVKCNDYAEYTEFITDSQLSFEPDGKMNFTVLTGVIPDSK